MLFGKKYVERVEEVAIDTLVLAEVRSGPATKDQLATRLRSVPPFSFTEEKIKDACERLDKDGHVKKENDRYTITDDGREDVQKIESWFGSLADRIGRSPSTPATGGTPGTATPGYPGSTTGTRRT